MFVVRDKEIALINGLLSKPSGSAMIYGKRKVGKTTLITEALKNSKDKTLYYECIKSSIEDNIDEMEKEVIKDLEKKLKKMFK